MLTYYITDRRQLSGDSYEQRKQLLLTIRRWAAAGVDYIQLREKDLAIGELERLAREALTIIRGEGQARLLINHRTDVALAVEADGVHLTGEDIAASDARALAAAVCSQRPLNQRPFLVAVSCRSSAQVRLAEAHGADFAVLAPIFEKVIQEKVVQEKVIQEKVVREDFLAPNAAEAAHRQVRQGIGLDELRRAAQGESNACALPLEGSIVCAGFPIFALGGIDPERARLCAEAGAAGIAGIRIFQTAADPGALVRALHAL